MLILSSRALLITVLQTTEELTVEFHRTLVLVPENVNQTLPAAFSKSVTCFSRRSSPSFS